MTTVTTGSQAFAGLLKSYGLSLTAAAQALGVSHPTILYWSTGQKRPKPQYRDKIEQWSNGQIPSSAWYTSQESESVGTVEQIQKAVRPANRRELKGVANVVYFVRAGTGPIKIGVATDLHRRVQCLQTAAHERLDVLGYVPNSKGLERSLHTCFAHARIAGGEWFNPTEDLLAWIRCNAQRVAEF